MTAQKIKWASQHEWFRFSGADEDGRFVACRNDMTEGLIYFYDFGLLKSWAGY